MVVLQYPAVLERDDNGTWLVTFPDLNDAVTFGDTPGAALAHAVDALEAVIISRMKHKLDVPTPGAARGKPLVTIPPLTAAKALLYKELRAQDISIRQLAEKLRCEYPVAHRLLDTSRKTQVNEIARALWGPGQARHHRGRGGHLTGPGPARPQGPGRGTGNLGREPGSSGQPARSSTRPG
jgi:antitoxin HicB